LERLTAREDIVGALDLLGLWNFVGFDGEKFDFLLFLIVVLEISHECLKLIEIRKAREHV
jgi:hypothetical protein